MSSLDHGFVKLDMMQQVARICWTHNDTNHTAIHLKIFVSTSLVSSNPGVSTGTRRLGIPELVWGEIVDERTMKGCRLVAHGLRLLCLFLAQLGVVEL